MSAEVQKDEKPLSSSSVKVMNNAAKRSKKVANQAVLDIAKEADKAGFGVSYGKYVQQNGL